MRDDFAGNFVSLQDLRHEADYDPSAVSSPSDVPNPADAADAAMAAFDQAAPDERADVLAPMLVDPRG